MKKKDSKEVCCNPSSGCCTPKREQTNLARRDFMKLTVLGTGAMALPTFAYCAGPFNFDQEDHLIPADKKLSEAWVKSLYERGVPEVYKKQQLRHIGMPIGGIACGQLYLGGDGKLWLWHIFKTEYSREKDHGQRFDAMTLGGHYEKPDKVFAREKRSVEQGAIIRVSSNGKSTTKTLDADGFNDVSFRGEYPIGKVSYNDADFPVSIALEAYSPFIPLNENDSALPTTIMNYKITNSSTENVVVEIAQWLENAVCPFVDSDAHGRRKNELSFKNDAVSLHFSTSGGTPELENQHGYGSMNLTLLENEDESFGNISTDNITNLTALLDSLKPIKKHSGSSTQSFGKKSMGVLGKSLKLKPGETKDVTFILSWYFPHLNQQENETGQLLSLQDIKSLKRHYANRFTSAAAVADYVVANYTQLSEATKLWNRTWYDSTMPYWLLDRSFISLNCLATNTALWFDNNRFWGWEGVECCPGTCQHVWQYAQGMARIFPALEKGLRENIDYGSSFQADGSMGHRDETAGGYGAQVAHDGHCGTIMRTLREHKMSANNRFLRDNYEKIKKSIQFIINEDKDKDGLLEGGQHNTLDASWYGPMGWISSLYLGALAAGKEMALEVNDIDFADTCNALLVKGRKNIVEELYNGEYFIHKPDSAHPNAINTNDGCLIDQVLGQSFAWQVGIEERIIPQKETLSALKSIWKYNFALDAFLYQQQNKPIKGARIYAASGEAGTIMCTWPKGGVEKAVPGMDKRPDTSETWLGPGGYFDEAMNGFEYQVASHMVSEGMLLEGLATTRAVHDRYSPDIRNPYNEIECSDHYSRSMASYGVFLSVCGYDYHGPKGHLSFNPKLTPNHFRAPFTVAEGWGSFSQRRTGSVQENTIELAYGKLSLSTIKLNAELKEVEVSAVFNNKPLEISKHIDEGVTIKFKPIDLRPSDIIKVKITKRE
jgi:non-lysosomal glucosylceramidase